MLLLWSRWVLFDYLVSSIINLWEGHHQWFDLQRITITKPSRASSAVKVVRAISLYPSLLVSRSVSTMLSSSKRFWHSNNFFPSFVSLQCHSSPWRRWWDLWQHNQPTSAIHGEQYPSPVAQLLQSLRGGPRQEASRIIPFYPLLMGRVLGINSKRGLGCAICCTCWAGVCIQNFSPLYSQLSTWPTLQNHP